jgi:hypothetical protein
MYVHPKRFRAMGLGVDLSSIPDVELREHLENARAEVDAFCNVPITPQPYSFKGGAITDEEHSWGRNNLRSKIHLFHTPIKEVTDFRILATESLYIEFNQPGDIFVSKAEGYIEVINLSLTKIGLWGQANTPQFGLIDPVARASYTYGRSYPVEDEELYPLTASGDEENTQYMASNGYWDPDIDPEITVDGVAPGIGTYSINRDSGIVTFTASQSAAADVRASYSYRVPRDVVRATALTAVALVGEKALVAKGMTGVESLKAEEIEIRRAGSRSGVEKATAVPVSAQLLLEGYRFMTMRGGS